RLEVGPRGQPLRGGVVVDELEQRHRRRVALARAELDHPCVAAVSLRKPRRDVREELVHHVVRAELGHREAPRVPSVIIFSAYGLTAFALASVVSIRPCVISADARFEYSALRCAESRPSFFPERAWRMATRATPRP